MIDLDAMILQLHTFGLTVTRRAQGSGPQATAHSTVISVTDSVCCTCSLCRGSGVVIHRTSATVSTSMLSGAA